MQLSRFISRTAQLIVGSSLALAAGLPAASACVNISGFIVDAGAAEAPIVCENIIWNGRLGGAALFDYQFFVASGGPGSIDFFGFGVGVPPAAVTSSNLGPTFFGNASLTGVLPVVAQANAVFTTNGAPFGWDFDEYTQAGGYFVDWNDQGVGTLPGAAALAINNNPGSIAALNGSFGVFNAISPFGPVAGFGVVDPPISGPIIELEFGGPGNLGDILGITPAQSSQVGPSTFCAGPNETIPGLPPCLDPNGDPVGFPDLPEPGTTALLGFGLAALACVRFRRPRR
jgi:hypothetical protein